MIPLFDQYALLSHPCEGHTSFHTFSAILPYAFEALSFLKALNFRNALQVVQRGDGHLARDPRLAPAPTGRLTFRGVPSKDFRLRV